MTVRYLIALAPLVISSAAIGQSDTSPLAPLFECRAIQDDTARLACTDAAIDTLHAGAESGDVVAVNRARINAAEEASFGLDGAGFGLSDLPRLSLPSLGSSESGDLADASTASDVNVVRGDDGQIDRIEGLAISTIRQNAHGRFIVELQNGQVWRQIDSARVWMRRDAQHDQMTASIKSASLGSHMMQFSGTNRWFRASRER